MPYSERRFAGSFRGFGKAADAKPAARQVRLRASVAARNFAYSLVPEMALPSNWILTPSKTEMLMQEASSLDVWLENTAKAIEKAATK
jgi:hypothetical protein